MHLPEGVAKLEYIHLSKLSVIISNKRKPTYLDSISEIDQHQVTSAVLSNGIVQANHSDHVKATTLNEVFAGNVLESFNCHIQSSCAFDIVHIASGKNLSFAW